MVVSFLSLDSDPDLLDLIFETFSSAGEAIMFSSSSELKTIGLLCLFEGRGSIPPYVTGDQRNISMTGRLRLWRNYSKPFEWIYVSDLVVLAHPSFGNNNPWDILLS